MPESRPTRADIDAARDYLTTGGLGETLGLAYMARQAGEAKVLIDVAMAIALCELAAPSCDVARALASVTPATPPN